VAVERADLPVDLVQLRGAEALVLDQLEGLTLDEFVVSGNERLPWAQ